MVLIAKDDFKIAKVMKNIEGVSINNFESINALDVMRTPIIVIDAKLMTETKKIAKKEKVDVKIKKEVKPKTVKVVKKVKVEKKKTVAKKTK